MQWSTSLIFSQLHRSVGVWKTLFFGQYPQKVSNDDNSQLSQIPSTDEICKAIQELSPDSSPGIDGYTGYLNMHCWDIICEDLSAVITGFFLGDHLFKGISSTTFILIPKVQDPNSLSQYRPISLSHFVSKVITKIIASRI